VDAAFEGENDMTGFPIQAGRGSSLTPRFEHATVGDVMRHGVITCSADTTLRAVARMMSSYHVHAVVVTEDDGEGRLAPWGMVSDFDLLRAAEAGAEDLTAGEVSRSAAVMVSPVDTLAHAAALMRERATGHLVVVAPESATPIGVVSTLDVAGVIAWGEA
jgi:CBS domain-containing protein